MTYFIGKLNSFRWWLLLILIVVAPFHAFLITGLKSALPEGTFLTVISGWREIAVVIIGLLVFIELLEKKRFPKFDLLDWLIVIYAILAFAFLPFQNSAVQWLLGFRYDILPFLFLLIVRRANWEKVSWLVRAALISAAVVLVFGLLHATVLPQNFLENFGYDQYQGEYVAGTPIAACQYLEHTQTVCRATSFFGGPTRYGTYLLLIIGLLLPFVIASSAKQSSFAILKKTGIYFLLALALLNIFLTYSRSIWIGTSIAALITFFILAARAKCSARSIGIGIIAILTAIFIAGTALLFSNIDLKTVLIRTSSTSAHAQLLKQGIQKLVAQPFGYGLGTVGPASVHKVAPFGRINNGNRFEKFLPENWYLQIGLEMGLTGLVLFLGILFLLFKNLLMSARADTACYPDPAERWSNVSLSLLKTGLFFALLGIAIAGLFTHSFEETTTVLILFGFIGIFSNLQVKNAIDKI